MNSAFFLFFATGFFAFKQEGVDVAHVASICHHCGSHEFCELFVIADGKLQMSGSDRLFVLVLASVACQFKDLTRQVLKHSCQEDCSSLSRSVTEATLLQVPVRAPNRKDQSSLG